MDFISTRPERIDDYRRLVKDLQDRFGRKDKPITARRKLLTLRQAENMTLEQFADESMKVAMDAHPEGTDRTKEDAAIDAFLKGAKDKQAAEAAMDKNPRSLRKAVQYMKTAAANKAAIYGQQKSFASRSLGVTWDLPEQTEELAVRQINSQVPKHKQSDKTSSLEKRLEELTQLLKSRHLERPSEGVGSTQPQTPPLRRAASPSRSPGRDITCFNCQKTGHFARACPDKSATPSPRRRDYQSSPSPKAGEKKSLN